MIEKRGQHEIEKMKEVVDPKKKGGGVWKKEEKNRNSQAHSGDAQVKRRIESTASETFKEKSKEKF